MKSGKNPENSIEREALSKVLSHAQSTHAAAPMQSATHSINLLEKRYNQKQCEEAETKIIEILEKRIASDLPEDQQRHFRDYLTKLSNSSIKYEFGLMCAAVLDTDDNAFIEPEYDAKKNEVFRIDSLFNAINGLRIQGRCEVGNRNDLLGILNFIHRDIRVIDDYTTFLTSSAKDWLISKWENSSSKEEMFSSVIDHIKNGQSDEACKLGDDDRASLIEHWKKNLQECGLNWDEAEKTANLVANNFYDITIPILPLYKIEMFSLLELDILNYFAMSNRLPSYLIGYQAQIKEAYIHVLKCKRFDEINAKGLIIFVNCIGLLKTINPNQNIVGTETELKLRETASSISGIIGKIIETWDFDGNDHHLTANLQLNEQQVRLTTAINAVKDVQPYHDFIENVFAIWKNTVLHYDENDPFEILESGVWVAIESLPASAWQVTDSDIQHIFESGETSDENLFIDVTPYQINRFILHALKTSPQEWSDMFTGAFKKLLEFLVQLEQHSENTAHALQLKVSSYPKEFVNQLNYLLLLRENRFNISAIEEGYLPGELFIPCKIDGLDITHLQKMSRKLTNLWSFIPLTRSIIPDFSDATLNDILNKLVSAYADLKNFVIAFIAFSIPKDRRIAFARDHSDRVYDQDTLFLVLCALRESDRYEYLQRHIDKIKSVSFFSGVLLLIPEPHKLEFANTYNHIITFYELFIHVMAELPNTDRLAFAIQHSEKISNGFEIVEVVKLLPANKRLEFAKLFADKISRYFVLYKIIKNLDKDERLAFANEFAHKVNDRNIDSILDTIDKLDKSEQPIFAKTVLSKITNIQFISKIIKHVTKSERLKCTVEIIDKINNEEDLCTILKCLPKADRINFIADQVGKIKDGLGFINVLKCIPKESQPIFISKNYSLVAFSRLHAQEVITLIPDEQKLKFLFKLKINYENQSDWVSMLELLPLNYRLEFAKYINDKFTDFSYFEKIINTLAKSDRLEFVKEYANKAANVDQLSSIIKLLPGESRLAFANSSTDKIEHIRHVLSILENLPEEDRLIFATNTIDKMIKNYQKFLYSDDLSNIMELLNEEDRLKFSNVFVDKVKWGVEIMIDYLPMTSRLTFATEHANFIFNGEYLVSIAKQLPKSDCIRFIKEQINKVDDALSLTFALRILPEYDRLGLAKVHANKITHDHQLIDVLRTLVRSDRLEFAINNFGRLQNNFDFGKVMRLLPESDRITFVNAHKNKIEDARDLCRIIKSLPAGERVAFANGFADIIIKYDSFADVLEYLPEDSMLKFAKDHGDKIDYCNGFELRYVLLALPKEYRAEFARHYAHKINNIEKLTEVLKTLPEAERHELARVHANLIKNTRGLALVLKTLSGTDRVVFAKSSADKIDDCRDFVFLIFEFAIGERLEVAVALVDKIANTRDLAIVLSTLQESERPIFEMKYKDILESKERRSQANKNGASIDNAKSLCLALRDLNNADRFELANSYADLIKDSSDLSAVIVLLPETSRLKFAKSHAGAINGVDPLTDLLKLLHMSDRFAFVREYADKVDSINTLCLVLGVMSEVDRLGIAIMHTEKIKHDFSFVKVLRELTESDRLTFANKCPGNEPIRRLGAVLGTLPNNQRLKYLISHAEIVKKHYDIEAVSKYLRSEDQTTFINHCTSKSKEIDVKHLQPEQQPTNIITPSKVISPPVITTTMEIFQEDTVQSQPKTDQIDDDFVIIDSPEDEAVPAIEMELITDIRNHLFALQSRRFRIDKEKHQHKIAVLVTALNVLEHNGNPDELNDCISKNTKWDKAIGTSKTAIIIGRVMQYLMATRDKGDVIEKDDKRPSRK